MPLARDATRAFPMTTIPPPVEAPPDADAPGATGDCPPSPTERDDATGDANRPLPSPAALWRAPSLNESGTLDDSEGEFQCLSFTVEPPFRGWRVDRYLCHKLPRLSRTKAQKLIRAGLVSDRPLKPSSPVLPGMVLTMRRRREDEPPTPGHLPLLHRDEDLLIFDKPAGLPIHATARYLRGTLVALARAQALDGEKPDPAHRLDRETSGIVVCGTHPASTRALKLAFAHGQVHKRYLAITEGWPVEDAFEVDAPLSVGGAIVRVRVFIDPVEGKPSRTRFRVIERREIAGHKFALVECEPLTGRQHQIRVHLASRGLAIVGDKIYGPDERIFARFAEFRLTEADRRLLRLPRHALHAAHIAFPHPRDGRLFEMTAPLPDDMRAFFDEGLIDQYA